MGCYDLRKYVDDPEVHNAFSKLLSGKSYYKALIERKKDEVKCTGCNTALTGNEKFCPCCGAKIEQGLKCKSCNSNLNEGDKFCSNCGVRAG
ncbi:zinc ribbon domain-containing protein [archaeon]|nr:zinc ribbon domain-containing protein [archaeon]